MEVLGEVVEMNHSFGIDGTYERLAQSSGLHLAALYIAFDGMSSPC